MYKITNRYYKQLDNSDKIFMYFILTMLLLLIPTVIVSKYANKVIVKKQIQANKNYVEYISKDTDYIFESVRNSCYSIMGTEYYDRYIDSFKEYDKDFPLYALKLSRDIKNIVNNSPYINNMLILSYDEDSKEGYIVSAEGTNGSTVYFDKINVQEKYGSGFWNSMVKDQFSIKLLPYSSLTTNRGTRTSKVIPMVVKKHYSTSHNTYMIVNIDEKLLFSYMKSSNITDSAHVYILNEATGEFLNSTDDLEITNKDNSELLLKAIKEGKSNVSIKLDGKKYLIDYQKSELSHISYVVVTSESAITADMKKVANISILVIIVFSIAGIILSLFFAKKINTPLCDTIRYIKGLIGDEQESPNEYEYLRNSFARMREIHNNSMSNVAHMLIYRAINQNLRAEEAKEIIRQYSLPLNKKYYAIMVIKANFNECQESLVLEDIKSIIKPFGELISINSYIFANFMNIEDHEELSKTLTAIEEKSNKLMGLKPELGLIMSISEIFQDITLSNKYYQQAYNILDIRSINKEKLIYTKCDAGNDSGHAYSRAEFGYLKNYAFNGNEKDSLLLLSKIFKSCRDVNMSFIRFRQVSDELLSIAIDLIEQKHIDPCCIFDSSKELLQSIYKIENTYKIEQACTEVYKQIIIYIKNKQCNNSAVDSIVRYIDDNISTVCLNEVADRFNMNPNYLSQYFKKHTGETFSNYINNKKFAAAKEKLINTDKTIEVISQELGFSKSSAFIRMFKQIEGLTPNAYREKSLQINNDFIKEPVI
ncbi:AraC family transcriptional regulator [Clostridium swellfunianum]|uniref:helix-turn-helix domain-containing protein n=1 Tax=Clostridium swellfunianum TaxID=1367462 RepID=UPI00202FC863|nr:AraC family transcriptional regulator [Clostridium swellfunianum]MCM0646992.1 AraC family transcriptional regulator [Clostridium swellfunianum]